MPWVPRRVLVALHAVISTNEDVVFKDHGILWCRECGASGHESHPFNHDPTCAVGILDAYLLRHPLRKRDDHLVQEVML